MKKAVILFVLCIILLVTGCGDKKYTGDIIPLESVPQYTREQLTDMLKGKSKEELNLAWGEKDSWFTTHPVEAWWIEDDDIRGVSVYYDENNLVANVVFQYDPSPSGAPGKEIPRLKVHWNGAEAETIVMGYSWLYTENGETIHMIADSPHPLEYTDKMNRMYADVHTYGRWDSYGVTLYFDVEPDAIDGCWWPLEQKGDVTAPPNPALYVHRQQSVSYPYGNNVCQITATWENAGTVNYCFILVNDISEYNKIK